MPRCVGREDAEVPGEPLEVADPVLPRAESPVEQDERRTGAPLAPDDPAALEVELVVAGARVQDGRGPRFAHPAAAPGPATTFAAPVQPGEHVLDGDPGDGEDRLRGVESDVRGQHDVLEPEERARRRERLVGEDVEPCPGEVPTREGVGEGRLVDDRAAGRVDEDGAPAHPCELVLADESLRPGCERDVNGDEVAPGEQRVERHGLHPCRCRALGRQVAGPGDDPHPERACHAREADRDPAEAHEAELLAASSMPTGAFVQAPARSARSNRETCRAQSSRSASACSATVPSA